MRCERLMPPAGVDGASRHMPWGTATTCPASTQRWSRLAQAAAVAGLRNAVCDFAADAGVCDPTLANLRLALSEAVSNAVVHSYRNDAAPGDVGVRATVEAGQVRVVVSDSGMGCVPRLDSPGLGVGLAIIASTATTFDIRDRDPAGTDVHMAFAR